MELGEHLVQERKKRQKLETKEKISEVIRAESGVLQHEGNMIKRKDVAAVFTG